MKSFSQLKKLSKLPIKSELKTINVAILGETATQLLHTSLKGMLFEFEYNCNIYEADYNQIDIEIFDTNSKLYSYKPDYIIIAYSVEYFRKVFYESNKKSKSDFALTKIKDLKNKIQYLREKISSRIIILNLNEDTDLVFGNYANKTSDSLLYQTRKFNLELMNIAQKINDLFICDVNAIQHQIGREKFFDERLYIQADMIYSLDALPYISKNIGDIIASIEGKFKKCLILDLDNTTWGGIIGDDGIEGIQIGQLGVGKAFTDLQLWAKELHNRGIILCVCSKNNEETAKEPFIKHPDMVLKLEDIVVFMANWDNKADNIRHIHEILNIGLDSMVFLDDNAFERNLVKEHLKDVTVPDLPDDPVNYLTYLKSLNLFETASYSIEDSSRTKKYQEEAKRRATKKTHTSMDSYLKSLEMYAQINSFDDFNIPRIAQLTQRSNQFNLRTRRYTEDEVLNSMKSENHLTFYIKLKDKFGDYGLISIVILIKQKDKLFIDTWIMSCRVLKRGVEKLLLNKVVEKAKELKFNTIIGEYIPTSKNIIVKDFYKDLNFKKKNKQWELKIKDHNNFDSFINLIKK